MFVLFQSWTKLHLS